MKYLLLSFITLFFLQEANSQISLPPESVSNSKELSLRGSVQRLISWTYSLKSPSEDTTAKGWCSISDFDQDGNLLNVVQYRPGGALVTRSTFTRPERNKVIVELFNRFNEKINTLVLTYNEQQELVEAHRHAEKIPGSDFKEVFGYDKFGNETKSISHLNKFGKTGDEKFIYNELHQKIESSKTTIRHINDSKSYFTYNFLGQLDGKKTVDPKDNNYVNSDFKYQNYDQFGNWLNEIEIDYVKNSEIKFVAREFPDSLKKIEAIPFEAKIIVIRTITYFKEP